MFLYRANGFELKSFGRLATSALLEVEGAQDRVKKLRVPCGMCVW
jgi:hypothetical protein